VGPRLTCTLAVGADSGDWFLCNAGPDVAVQLRDWPEMSPRPDGRVSLQGVLLTDAELDHTVGLLSLREADGLRIYGTGAVRDLLTECGLLPTLRCYTRVDWCEVQPGEEFDLLYRDGSSSGLSCSAVEVAAGRMPRYARSTPASSEAVIGYVVRDRDAGTSAALAPSVATDDDRVVSALGCTDLALIDGTFYEDDELYRAGRGHASAHSMGHIPIRHGKLGDRIRSCGARVVYTHVNNTNRIILAGSTERASLVAQGYLIAEDEMEFVL